MAELNKNTGRHKHIRQQGVTETMAESKNPWLIIGRPLQNPSQSFREGHVAFATDKKGKIR